MKKAWVLGGVLVVGALLFYLSAAPAEKTDQLWGQMLQVGSAEVQPATFVRQIEAVGTTVAMESVNITTTLTETIASVNFTEGQKVAQGDILATLSQQEELAVKEQAELDLAEQERELRRLEGLRKTNAISQTDFDRQVTRAEQARLRLAETDAKIEDRVIRAPFSGVVGLRNLSAGALVRPGDVITTVDQIDKLKIDIAIPAVRVGQIGVGTTITAVAGNNTGAVEGEIIALDTRVNVASRTIGARAVIDNSSGKLLPGMLVKVNVAGLSVESYKVPEGSVMLRGAEQFVYVINDQQQAIATPVEVEGRTAGWAYIAKTLPAGSQVVTEGIHQLRSGDTVKIKETPSTVADTPTAASEQSE